MLDGMLHHMALLLIKFLRHFLFPQRISYLDKKKAKPRTSHSHLSTNVEADKCRQEMDFSQPEDLAIFVVLVIIRVSSICVDLTDFSETF